MDAQELRNLQEAYLEVVMNEGKKPYPVQRVRNQIERIRQRGGDNWKLRQSYEDELRRQAKEHEIKKAEKRSPTFYQQKNKLKMTKTQREQVDLYDIILSHLLDEGSAQNVADRAQKLANQRKGQTPERKATYQSLANKADERANPKPEADWRTGISDSTRKMNVSTYADRDKVKIKTTNPKKLRKQKAMGELKDSFDLYDIILSHLLDEGYAETPEEAEVIMVNMSEDWREEIMEGMTMKDFKANRRNIKRRETSADARKRGHEGKTWADSGRTYSPDEAKSRRAKMTDAKRQASYRVANDPDDDSPNDDHYPASKTKNPKKLRKQTAMGEH